MTSGLSSRLGGIALLIAGLGCSSKKEPAPAPAVEPAAEPAPASARGDLSERFAKLDPPERGPKARSLSAPIPERLAPQACLRVPAKPPFAALFHRDAGGSQDRFVFFTNGEDVALYHRDDRIEVFVRQGDSKAVQAFTAPPSTGRLGTAAPDPDRDEWVEVSSPFPTAEIDDLEPGLMALQPRRCGEVQTMKGKLDGRTVTVFQLPGLGVPESATIEGGERPSELVLIGFLSADTYADLTARAQAAARPQP